MIALDTNLLVYAETISDLQGRHLRMRALLDPLSSGDSIIPLTVLGEFLNVCRKKKVLAAEAAARRVEQYSQFFLTPPTTNADLVAAALLADSRNLQFFDALIVTVAARAGATVLLTEDLQDGLQLEGLQIVNPFDPANADAIDRFLTN